MNHDLIAAGHPRLNFEYASYMASYPKHWNERTTDPADFEAKSWVIGQVVTARAVLQLLADRALASQPGAVRKAPAPEAVWPEFSEYECFSCHHGLVKNSPLQTEGHVRGKPGQLPWATWPLAGARTGRGELAGVEVVCRSLQPGDSLLVIGDQPGWSRWPQTVHSICGVPAAVVHPQGSDVGADVQRVAQRVRAVGRRPVVLLTVDPQKTPNLGVPSWTHVTFDTWADQNLLVRRPEGVKRAAWTVYVGPWSSVAPAQ